MGLFAWFARRGIAGAISRDLCAKFHLLSDRHGEEDEEQLVRRLWEIWLRLNEDPIKREDDMDKQVRLSIMMEARGQPSATWTLFSLYRDILYIETELLPTDKRLYDTALKVFVDVSTAHGLDYRKQYSSYKRTMQLTGNL